MLAQAAVEGLVHGGLYALLGIGFYLTFGVLRRINLAFGSSIMVSVYGAAMLVRGGGLAWWLTLPIALALGLAVMALVERLSFNWVQADARFSMVSALGIWMAIEELVLQSPGRGRGQPLENPFDQTMLDLAGFSLRLDHLIAFGLSMALAGAVWLLLFRSRWGLALRVVASDRALAGLLGIDVRKATHGSHALAAAVGVFAGYVFATAQNAIDVHFAMWSTIKGLVILVLGGIVSLPGIVAAALGLGMLERMGTEAIGMGYRDVVGYGLMLCLLTIFPKGLGGGQGGRA